MRALALFLLAMVITLSARLFFLRRSRRRDLDGEAYGIEHKTTPYFGWDPLTSELSGRIFNPEDLDFVGGETSWQITRQFRRERSVLALEWLRAVHGHVNQLMWTHFRASRRNDDLRPAEEIKLWFEFLLFQVTSGTLYLVIWVCGPTCAADLLGYSLGLAAQLRKVTEEVLPAGRQVGAELINNKQEPNGDAVG